MNTADQEIIKLDDLRSIEQLINEYPKVLTVPMLRGQLRHRTKTGLARACVRMGRCLLISKSRYEQWLNSQAEAQ